MGTLIGEEINCTYYPGEQTPNIALEENEIIIDLKECIQIKNKQSCPQAEPAKPEHGQPSIWAN